LNSYAQTLTKGTEMKIQIKEADLRSVLTALENSRSLESVDVEWVKGARQAAIRICEQALAASLDASLDEDQAHYKKVIDDVQALFEAKREQQELAEASVKLVSTSVEPVAVYVGETWCGSVVRLYDDLPLETPLYTSPPQDALVSALYSKIDYLRGKIELLESGLVQAKRTWRGLTKEERVDFTLGCGSYETVCAIEAKLKEKNCENE
jgi:hypothetical protein